MGDGTALTVDDDLNSSNSSSHVLDIYPLNCYYFGSKQALSLNDETIADRVDRMKSNYAAHGLRTCVEAVILVGRSSLYVDECALPPIFSLLMKKFRVYDMSLKRSSIQVELFKHPHVLLLQIRNCVFKLPGGRLRPGESDIDGLKRKLARKLSVGEEGSGLDWEVGECLGMWWRPDFETLLYPYLPPNVKKPKECIKLFLVKLPASRRFTVPRNFKLLAVPLCQIHEDHKTYGPIISGVPQLLSKFSFNIIEP